MEASSAVREPTKMPGEVGTKPVSERANDEAIVVVVAVVGKPRLEGEDSEIVGCAPIVSSVLNGPSRSLKASRHTSAEWRKGS